MVCDVLHGSKCHGLWFRFNIIRVEGLFAGDMAWDTFES